jgi:acetyl esterase/lipase
MTRSVMLSGLLWPGVDARVDVWECMPHGFLSGIGTLAASEQALDEIGRFLADRLNLVKLD